MTAKDKRLQIFVYIQDNQLLLDQVHFYITHLYENIKKRQVDKGACMSSTKLLHFSLQEYFGFIKATYPSKNLIMFLFDPPLSPALPGSEAGGWGGRENELCFL